MPSFPIHVRYVGRRQYLLVGTYGPTCQYQILEDEVSEFRLNVQVPVGRETVVYITGTGR